MYINFKTNKINFSTVKTRSKKDEKTVNKTVNKITKNRRSQKMKVATGAGFRNKILPFSDYGSEGFRFES